MRRISAAAPSKLTRFERTASPSGSCPTQTWYSDPMSDVIVTSTSKPGSVRHTEGTPRSTTIQNRRGVIGEPDVQHMAFAGERRGVESGVHPPDQELGVQLFRCRVAECPSGTPPPEVEQDRLELLAGVGQQILAAETFDEPRPLELAQPFVKRLRDRPGSPRARSL